MKIDSVKALSGLRGLLLPGVPVNPKRGQLALDDGALVRHDGISWKRVTAITKL